MSDDPLDQVNRFAISVLALVLLFGALIVVLLTWGASAGSIDKIADLAGYLRDHDHRAEKLIVTLSMAVVALLMLMVMIVELTPSPLQKMRVRNVKAGDATVSTTEIAQRVEEEVRMVEHVRACDAIVAARGSRVEIALELQVDASADLAHTADEACRRAHALVEERMGIGLAQRPRARLHYRELRLKDDGTRVPDEMRRRETGWERPGDKDRGEDDDRGNTDAPEEAQA